MIETKNKKTQKNSSLLDERLDTKLTLRKIKLKDALSKKKLLPSNNPGLTKLDKFTEDKLTIKVDHLGLKSDILNKAYNTEDFNDFFTFQCDLLSSNDLNKIKYSVSVLKNIIVSLDDKTPKEFSSITFLSKLYLVISSYPYEYDLVVSIYEK